MTPHSKVKTLDELACILNLLRKKRKTIVHCHGVFDLVDRRDLAHFEAARAMGDLLVVTLTRDEFARDGGRAAVPARLRAEVIASLAMVDYVALTPWPTGAETIRLLRPDVYAVKPNRASEERRWAHGLEEEAMRGIGGRIRYTSPRLRGAEDEGLGDADGSPERESFLDHVRQRFSSTEVRAQLDAFAKLKVLVVGEAILDEYVYCDAMGKSGKEPMMVMRHRSLDVHAGGSLAIANHVGEFSPQVRLLTYLGATNSREEIIRSRMKREVRADFIYRTDAPTIVKRRYIDNYTRSKLFGFYDLDDEPLSPAEDDVFCEALARALPEADVVIVADYGHGLITPRAIQLMCDKARFLAVNTQLNAGNAGFHTISRYPRADYVCIHEGEIRLDMRSVRGDVRELTNDVARRLSTKTIMVTRGKLGTLIHREGEGFHECPAFADRVVDRMGAGDAVLALTSLCAAAGTPPEVMGFLGNLAGAQAVATVGNCRSISRARLIEAIDTNLADHVLRRAVA